MTMKKKHSLTITFIVPLQRKTRNWLMGQGEYTSLRTTKAVANAKIAETLKIFCNKGLVATKTLAASFKIVVSE